MVKMCNSYNIIYLPLPTVLMNGNSKRLHNKKKKVLLITHKAKRRILLRLELRLPLVFSSCQNYSNVDSDMEMYQRKGNERKSWGPKIQFPCSPNKIVAHGKRRQLRPRRHSAWKNFTNLDNPDRYIITQRWSSAAATSKQPNKIAFS